MIKILRNHGIAALVIGALLVISYLYTDSLHGGIDSVGLAIAASSITLVLAGAFILNLFLLLTDTILYFSPVKARIVLSCVLLFLYAAALLYVIYDAFAFSYGRFFSYLAEGEFFSILHVLFMLVLLIMIIIRFVKLRKLRNA